ncbi:hypothetical protein EDD92_0131 [Streptomyces sp. TLI_185]|nr:hypothetical protein EDD92_0131 [Streptomyces sp. TLI_185]
MTDRQLPGVGDEVEYQPGCRAIVTDVSHGVPILRAAARSEWPADNPDQLVVTRTRQERIEAEA